MYLHYIMYVRPNKSRQELLPYATVITEIYGRALCFVEQGLQDEHFGMYATYSTSSLPTPNHFLSS